MKTYASLKKTEVWLIYNIALVSGIQDLCFILKPYPPLLNLNIVRAETRFPAPITGPRAEQMAENLLKQKHTQ